MSRGFCVGTTADVPCPASAKPATDDAASPRNRSKGSDQHEREPLLARHRAHPSSPESSLEVMPLTLRHPYDGVKYRLPMELIALRNGALDSTLRWVYDWDMTTTDVSGENGQPEIIHTSDVLTPQERAVVRAAVRRSWPLRSCGLRHTGACPVEDYDHEGAANFASRTTMTTCDPEVVMDVFGSNDET